MLLRVALLVLVGAGSSAGEELIEGKTFERRFEYERGTEALTLASGGQAEYVIVVATRSSPPVAFAAAELKAYLDRITGCDFQITKEIPADGRGLILGDCAEARAVGIDVEDIARDGYQIVTRAKTIFIAGRDEGPGKADVLFALTQTPRPAVNTLPEAWDFHRGTLYGAYRFLEELGVRWFLPGPKGEVVPKSETLELTAFSLIEEPTFDLRQFGTVSWDSGKLRRSRLYHKDEYRSLGWDPAGVLHRHWLLRVRASSAWYAFNHRPKRLQWEQRFASTHPEYFALRAGDKRDLAPDSRGQTGHLCYTDDGVYRQTLADIDAFFAGKSPRDAGISADEWNTAACYGNTVSLLPHDSFTPKACRCAGCRSLTHPNAPHWQQHSDLVWQFVDRAARAVEQRHPGKVITCLAYSSYTEVPRQISQLPDNVMVGICPYSLNKTFNLLNDRRYSAYMSLVKRWAAVNQMPLLFWEHHLIRSSTYAETLYGVPSHYPHFFGRYFRDISKYGRMMHMQCAVDSVVFEHLNRYIGFRVMFNPQENVDGILADYYRKFYGPGAALAEELLSDIERRSVAIARAVEGETRWVNIEPDRIWNEFLSADVLAHYRSQADELQRVTTGTPHAEAARLLADHFVGAMEEGSRRHLAHKR